MSRKVDGMILNKIDDVISKIKKDNIAHKKK